VPLQVEVLLFNIDRKKQRKRECFACREKSTSGTTVQIWLKPQKGGAKARRLQVSKLGMILQAKMILQGLTATALHHALHCHQINALWQEVKQVSRPLVMIVMMRESPPYMNLRMPLNFLRMYALSKRLNLKL
jgi:hypothetical protein